MNSPLVSDAFPDHHIFAAIEGRTIAAPARISTDLDRCHSINVEFLCLKFQRVSPDGGEFEHGLDRGTSANYLHVRDQHLSIFRIASRDARCVITVNRCKKRRWTAEISVDGLLFEFIEDALVWSAPIGA